MDKLNLIASYLAVVEEGSFTAAAKRIGKTTALISTHISQLEENLQVRLVTRSTRSIKLTSIGRSYYEEAKRVIDDIATLEANLRQENESLIGSIRITAPTTFGELVLAPLIADIIHQHPQLQIELSLSDRFVDIVSEGFDMAVRIGQLEDSSLIARKVSTTKIIACASPEFIEKYGVPDTPDDLQNFPCIFDTNIRNNYWQFNDGQQNYHVKPKVIMKVNSAVAAATLAASGVGICTSPYFAVQEAIEQGKLIPVLHRYTQADIPIHVVYTYRKHLSGKVSSLLEILSQHI